MNGDLIQRRLSPYIASSLGALIQTAPIDGSRPCRNSSESNSTPRQRPQSAWSRPIIVRRQHDTARP